jgi:uncharacterized linocin/CFP29 family protein
MNILKKSLAPITDNAWKEIHEQADMIFKTYLTARKFVDIDGPNGLEQAGVSTGRLKASQNQSKEGINYGVREILPLIEIRKPFELDIWELDNIERGAKDIDLDSLEKAAKQIALFEENAIYEGFSEGQIKGLIQVPASQKVETPDDPNEFLKILGAQILSLKIHGVEGPYTLIVGNQKYQDLISISKGYPVMKQLKDMLQGQIIVNQSGSTTYLVSERGDDFELTLGQDISIGYDGHDTDKVKLYFTESFTFRVLSPEAIRVLTHSGK